jgi:hypothetical protein
VNPPGTSDRFSARVYTPAVRRTLRRVRAFLLKVLNVRVLVLLLILLTAIVLRHYFLIGWLFVRNVAWPFASHIGAESHAEWVTAYATILLSLIALVAGIITVRQVILTRQVERSQTFLEISERWNNREFRDTRIEIRDVYYAMDSSSFLVKLTLLGWANADEQLYWQCMEALNFFETVAILRKQRALTFRVIIRVWGFVIWDYWAMMHEFVVHQREQVPPHDKMFCKDFERLANKIANHKGWGKPWKDPTADKPTLYM